MNGTHDGKARPALDRLLASDDLAYPGFQTVAFDCCRRAVQSSFASRDKLNMSPGTLPPQRCGQADAIPAAVAVAKSGPIGRSAVPGKCSQPIVLGFEIGDNGNGENPDVQDAWISACSRNSLYRKEGSRPLGNWSQCRGSGTPPRPRN